MKDMTAENAPEWYSLDEATAWAAGYNSALAALPTVQPVVKVKPLVWEPSLGTDRTKKGKCSDRLDYKSGCTEGGDWFSWPVFLPHVKWGPFGTDEEAKAAAQADYEARILAALDVQPAPDVAALVRDLKKMVKAAYCEGFRDGKDGGWIVGPENQPWNASDIRKALAAWEARNG